MTINEPSWMDLAKEAVARALCALFGLVWESDEALAFMRYAYTDDNPEPDRTTDVVYIDLRPVDSPPANRSFTYYGDTADVESDVALNCVMTFYGAHAVEHALEAHHLIMVDTGPGCPRDILRQHNMVIVEKPASPTSVREPYDEISWRMRADMTVRINLLRVVSLPYTPIQETPDITITAR